MCVCQYMSQLNAKQPVPSYVHPARKGEPGATCHGTMAAVRVVASAQQ